MLEASRKLFLASLLSLCSCALSSNGHLRTHHSREMRQVDLKRSSGKAGVRAIDWEALLLS